jgi:hypothetical protein
MATPRAELVVAWRACNIYLHPSLRFLCLISVIQSSSIVPPILTVSLLEKVVSDAEAGNIEQMKSGEEDG